MSKWINYKNGSTIGTTSAEGAVILRDEEHERGGRVTLKQGETFVSVSCHIYGKIDHTRFFNSVPEAQRDFIVMKNVLGSILDDILGTGADEIKVWEAIADFVRRFP